VHCGTIVACSGLSDRVYIKPVQEFLASHPALVDAQLHQRRPSIEDGTRALGWISHLAVGARERFPVGAYVHFELDACDTTSASHVVLSSHADEFGTTEWKCQACTYLNAPDFLNCEMCFSARSVAAQSVSNTIAECSKPPPFAPHADVWYDVKPEGELQDASGIALPTYQEQSVAGNIDAKQIRLRGAAWHTREIDDAASYECSQQEDVSMWIREAETEPALKRVFMVLWRSSPTLRALVEEIVQRHGHQIAFKAMDSIDEMAAFPFEACFYWSDWAVLIKDAQRKDDASLANSIAFELANGYHHAEFAQLFSIAEETTKRHASQATSFAMQAEAIEKKSVDLQKRVMREAIDNGTGKVTAAWAGFGTDALPWFHPDHLYPQGTQLVWLADAPHFEYWRRVYIDRFQWGIDSRAEYLQQREIHSGNRELYEQAARSCCAT
jgi:hypothetical protein